MDSLGNVVFKDREIENERLELTDKKANYILGPNLTLKNCTLVLKVPARRLSTKQARFIDCTFEVKQELKNYQAWVAASLKGCRFKGHLRGCDFGHWPEYSSLPWYQHGSIEDCDFTEACLDGCRIMGSDPATIRFPKWPCFTILDPIGRAPELRGLTWPGPLGELIRDMLPKHPPRTRALTYYAPSAAKLVETTPEEIRAVIEKFDCIVY
ncbi:pentapeptide repeat-containing protein [Vitiosangium sp. GDMCC 1.1324]|uniref:pentapeptide repeat-containing protein n=1 Tax=Vitiosangium sp. (strain GDMCC 1.1324) TaxID=2138576 RepID=UPI000D3AC878|nr:pentapeptide repeat-containing protein [Vitiosangium sp. GDMCC 1.1324]PTL81667.1 hypothetical protein DAT35_22245 [Vitiosangium sp. GDMCC 1.1324]